MLATAHVTFPAHRPWPWRCPPLAPPCPALPCPHQRVAYAREGRQSARGQQNELSISVSLMQCDVCFRPPRAHPQAPPSLLLRMLAVRVGNPAEHHAGTASCMGRGWWVVLPSDGHVGGEQP